MAEPIPSDLGSEDQKRARMLLARNMFICGLIIGGVVGFGFATSFGDTGQSTTFFAIAMALLIAWFLFSRRSS